MRSTPMARVPKGFLKRKFAAPALPSFYVRETRITAQMMDLDSWRVCLLDVAPGYGKTALLSQWFEEYAQRDDCLPLWMTLDAHDAHGERFARGMAFLLSSVDACFGALCADGPAGEMLLTDLVNLMDEATDPAVTYVIFLDSYDQASSAELDRTLLFLNRFCGENFRFVVAGNYFSPRIDDLLLLESSVVEYATCDLLLDEDRLRKFAFSLMPDLSEQEYQEICLSSGSWPTSFVFNHLARKRSGGAEVAKVLDGYHRRFFAKEVMDRVDAATYEFLVETAGLDCMVVELCDKVTGGTRSDVILEYLVEHNLFVHYDAGLAGYVYQPAFKRFLVEKLLALHPGYVAKLAGRAGAWYSSRQMRLEAAKFAVVASDARYVQGTIKSSIGLEWQGGSTCSSFLDYLLSSPAESFVRDEYLAWAAVWSYISMGLPDEARYWISQAKGLGAGEEREKVFSYADAICLALEGNSAASLEVIRRLLREGEGELPRAFQCLLIHMEGENCERLGNPREGRDLYYKALSLAERADGAFYRLFDIYCLAHQCLCTGDFDEAVSLAERALKSCETGESLFGELHAILSFVQIERGELAAAQRSVALACARVSQNANMDMYVDAHLARARYEYAAGNVIEAFEIASDVVAATAGKQVPRHLDIEAYALLTLYAVELGEISTIWACEKVLDAYGGNADVLRAVPCMIGKARILQNRGAYDACFDLIARCHQAVQACASSYYLTELCIVEAVCRSECGSDAQAMISAGKAVEHALRGGFLTVFKTGGKVMRELLLNLATSRKVSLPLRNYAKRVLLLFDSESDVSNEIALSEGDVRGYYALTEREREVLRALNAGMSRCELAEHFGVSQNTVKTHLKSIYAKLGVHTRSEAYRASQEAGQI